MEEGFHFDVNDPRNIILVDKLREKRNKRMNELILRD